MISKRRRHFPHITSINGYIILRENFGEQIISRFGPVDWPPRSCDITTSFRGLTKNQYIYLTLPTVAFLLSFAQILSIKTNAGVFLISDLCYLFLILIFYQLSHSYPFFFCSEYSIIKTVFGFWNMPMGWPLLLLPPLYICICINKYIIYRHGWFK